MWSGRHYLSVIGLCLEVSGCNVTGMLKLGLNLVPPGPAGRGTRSGDRMGEVRGIQFAVWRAVDSLFEPSLDCVEGVVDPRLGPPAGSLRALLRARRSRLNSRPLSARYVTRAAPPTLSQTLPPRPPTLSTPPPMVTHHRGVRGAPLQRDRQNRFCPLRRSLVSTRPRPLRLSGPRAPTRRATS